MKTIFASVAGSYMFGTHKEGSDVDVRCVHVPSLREVVLGKTSKSDYEPANDLNLLKPRLYDKAEHLIKKKYGVNVDRTDDDLSSMNLRNFVYNVGRGEVTCVELSFAPSDLYLVGSDKEGIWKEFLDIRPHILTSNIKSSLGFCRGISYKFGVRLERLQIVEAAFELLSDLIDRYDNHAKLGEFAKELEQLKSLDHVKFTEAEGNAPDTLWVCDRGLQYSASLKFNYEIISKVYENYSKRAKKSHKNDKADWKAIMHAVRVGNQTIELLTTGEITYPSEPNDFYLQIRNGEIDQDELVDMMDKQEREIYDIVDNGKSVLPETPDTQLMEDFIYDVYTR